MYKLIALLAVVAVCMGAPAPSGLLAYSAPLTPVHVVSPVAPHLVSPVVSHVVAPQVTSYSAHSSSVVHGVPIYSAPLVHAVPQTYHSGVVVL